MDTVHLPKSHPTARCAGRNGVVLALLACSLLAGTPVYAAVTAAGQTFGSIQAAVDAVIGRALPNGTVIEIGPGTYREALVIDVDDSRGPKNQTFTLRGAGPGITVLSGQGLGRSVIYLKGRNGSRIAGVRLERLSVVQGGIGVDDESRAGGMTVEDASPVLREVQFAGNSAFDAGAVVLSRSDAVFEQCAFDGNTARRFGGALKITTGSRPTFTSTTFTNNQSGLASTIGSGGAVHANDASPAFRGCTFARNTARFAGGAVFHMGVYGSANGTAMLLLEDTQVTFNVAAAAAGMPPAEGGGVHAEDNAQAILVRTRVDNNRANTGGGLNSYRANYAIRDSIVEWNSADGGFGGGLSMTNNDVDGASRQAARIEVWRSVVRSNAARVGGGILVSGDQVCNGGACSATEPGNRAALVVSGSLVANNRATYQAGGIRLDRADATITSSHVLLNEAQPSEGSYGGGFLVAQAAALTMSDVTVAANRAGAFGGGLFASERARITVSASQIYGNSAAGNGGGGLYIGGQGSDAAGGTVTSSVIADNVGYQIRELACPSSTRTLVAYTNNALATPPDPAESGKVYYSDCGGTTSTISSFNALAPSRTSGNRIETPTFLSARSVVEIGPTVIAWVAARASSVVVGGAHTAPGTTGSIDVALPTSTQVSVAASTGRVASVPVVAVQNFGAAGDVAVPADFDGDGTTDVAVYRPATGTWFAALSSGGTVQLVFGAAGLDVPVPADYDGDRRTDPAVYRPTTGEWFVLQSSRGFMRVQWGQPNEDSPVPADYDGDGRADVAVYRSSAGVWFLSQSTQGARTAAWGAPSLGDRPVPADYDGDGRADVGVYRASTGQWLLARSSAGPVTFTYGSPALGDVPAPADYDGDGRADATVVRTRTGEWFISGRAPLLLGSGDARFPYRRAGQPTRPGVWTAAAGKWVIAP